MKVLCKFASGLFSAKQKIDDSAATQVSDRAETALGADRPAHGNFLPKKVNKGKRLSLAEMERGRDCRYEHRCTIGTWVGRDPQLG